MIYEHFFVMLRRILSVINIEPRFVSTNFMLFAVELRFDWCSRHMWNNMTRQFYEIVSHVMLFYPSNTNIVDSICFYCAGLGRLLSHRSHIKGNVVKHTQRCYRNVYKLLL